MRLTAAIAKKIMPDATMKIVFGYWATVMP